MEVILTEGYSHNYYQSKTDSVKRRAREKYIHSLTNKNHPITLLHINKDKQKSCNISLLHNKTQKKSELIKIEKESSKYRAYIETLSKIKKSCIILLTITLSLQLLI